MSKAICTTLFHCTLIAHGTILRGFPICKNSILNLVPLLGCSWDEIIVIADNLHFHPDNIDYIGKYFEDTPDYSTLIQFGIVVKDEWDEWLIKHSMGCPTITPLNITHATP